MMHFWAKRIAVLAALATLAAAASAQYIWLDENGVKQYSDLPPGPSVPLNKILKEPAARAQQQKATTPAGANDKAEGTPPVAAPAAASAPKAPLTVAEQNADFAKRKMEREEKEKKAAEQAKLAADKAKNCDRARSYSRSLSAGERIFSTDKDGNRTYLNDDQRAREANEVNNVLNNCK